MMTVERLQELKEMAERSRQCVVLHEPGKPERIAARTDEMRLAWAQLHQCPGHPEAIVLELVAEVERLRAALAARMASEQGEGWGEPR